MKRWQVVLSVFLFSACSMLMVFSVVEKIEYERNRAELQYFTQNYAQRIEMMSLHLLQKAKIIAELVRLNPQDVSWFHKVAESLHEDPTVLCLQLIKDGNFLAGEPVSCLALAADPQEFRQAVQKACESAVSTGNPVLYGPVDLRDGGMAVLGIQPVYIHNSQQGFDTWGESLLLLRVPAALDKADFMGIESAGYAYVLRSVDTDARQIITQAAVPVGEDPVREIIHVPNGRWVLEVEPVTGWHDTSRLLVEAAIGLGISLLVSFLTLCFLRLREQREDMRARAVTDPLTQLSNRHILMDELAKRCKNRKDHFLVCYMDLNDFKQVNDTYGHDIGDELIKAAAQRIKHCLKSEDSLFRIGGDEFVAVLEPEADSGWKERTLRIEQELRRMFVLDEICVDISVSVGCAVYPQTAESPGELLRTADLRMFKNKERFS
jgi:diguanylate cyclase (GGDEF)-like protein